MLSTDCMPKINASGGHNPFYFHNMTFLQVKQDIKWEYKVEMSEKCVFHIRMEPGWMQVCQNNVWIKLLGYCLTV